MVLTNVNERIGYLTLNRPEKRNALNPQLVAALKEALDHWKTDNSVRAVVLKAEGKAFSAGADLAYLQSLQSNTYDENLADSRHLKELFLTLDTYPKPVIAQVEGHAIAGGCGLATVCDFVFAVPEAKFGYTEVRIGFVPALVLTFLLRKVSESVARDLLLTGRLVDANEAQALGIIHRVVAKDDIAEHVRSFVTDMLATTSGEAIATTKELMQKVRTLSTEEAFDLAATYNAKARSSEDCKRGIQAFLSKEKITW